MTAVSLELFKKHVRADDFAEDDDLLAFYLAAAEEAVVRYTHRSAEELTEAGGGLLPLPLQQAVMLLGAHWYNQRESASAVQMHEVPGTLQSLIKPFRRLCPAPKTEEDASGTDALQA